MDRAAVEALQISLRGAGYFAGVVNGRRDRPLDAAISRALDDRGEALPEDWPTWSAKRKAVALVQLLCRDAGHDPGALDGWWGPFTDHAFALLDDRRAGRATRFWRDERPLEANPNGWPAEAGVAARFGPPGGAGAEPPLVRVPSPWRLKSAWNHNQTRSTLRVHRDVAPSLARVLARVWSRYGPEEIARLGLDIWGGDYAPRLMRGSLRRSLHAWGLAIDFAPLDNPLPAGRDRARFAGAEYLDWWAIWEAEGWVSLGRTRNEEWGHVQAARL